jgi:osmotically-inducible protein OsmY
VPATVALVLSLSTVGVAFASDRVQMDASKTTALRAPGALGSRPWSGGQRAADRVIERRVRGAIRADPFLALAAPHVKVTSRHGVVRLVGQVRTAKEQSSIAFKAGQNAQVEHVDDRVTIVGGFEGATR